MRIKKRYFGRENVIIFIGALLAVVLVLIADRKGMSQKWHSAIFGTLVPFLVVLLSLRLRWRRWSFWASVFICLAIHTLAIWIFFQYVLSNVRSLGMLIWSPVALVEVVVLLVVVKRVEEKLTSKSEKYKLS